MKMVSYYLARCGVRLSDEPARPRSSLNVNTWKDAYDIFYDALGDGRTLLQFRNSMKNARDSFDILFENGRVGWIGKDLQESPLSAGFKTIHQEWEL